MRQTAVMAFVLIVCAGCGSGPLRGLVSEDDVPHLAALKHRGEMLSRTITRVDVGSRAAPLRLAVHEVKTPASGRVIVLIHGLLSDSRAWRFMLGELAREADVWAVDLPGCGRSDPIRPHDAPRRCSQRGLARATLLALRARLEQSGRSEDRLVLVGHSLGGMLILRMFADEVLRREFADVLGRVERVVLLTPIDVEIGNVHPAFVQLLSLSGFHVALGDVLGVLPARAAAATREGVLPPTPALREEAQRLLDVLRDARSRRAMQAMIRQAVPFEGRRRDWDRIRLITNRYREVDVPLLIVWGARDELFPVAMGYKLASELPRARLVVLPDAMHSLPIERPAECAELIRAFVAESPLPQRTARILSPIRASATIGW